MYEETRQEIMRPEIDIRHDSEVNKSSYEPGKTVKNNHFSTVEIKQKTTMN